jgi:hypothetical protein
LRTCCWYCIYVGGGVASEYIVHMDIVLFHMAFHFFSIFFLELKFFLIIDGLLD